MDDQSPAFTLHKLVTEMDKVADDILQKHFQLSYKRFHFLLVLQQQGTVSQHALAQALGYSDPAVSNMVHILAAGKYLTVRQSEHHRRKRLVTLTPKGEALARTASALLSQHFNAVMAQAGVDSRKYDTQTKHLLQSLRAYKATN